MNRRQISPCLECVWPVLVFLCALCLFGCQRLPSNEEADLDPKTEETTDTTLVICGGNGVSVLTKRVESRPDGVHLEVSNLLEGRAELSVSHSGGGMDCSVPKGESKRVANVPPGKVEIDCYPSWARGRLPMMEVETLEVVAGDSSYKSAKLDCPRGKPAGGMKPFTKAETRAHAGDPVDLLPRELSGSLREGDIVEIAGNVQSRNEKTVRVVRDGEVVANADYIRVSNGWLGGLTENCAKF